MKACRGLIVLAAAAAALLAGTGLAADAPAAGEQHCKLELVRLSADGPDSPAAIACRNVSPQSFSTQITDGVASFVDDATFKKAVKKEPAKYHAKHPMRGVATLGSKQYGFVLDQRDEKSKDYDRLYFDLNGNGDLTDDKPIDKPVQKAAGGWLRTFLGDDSTAEPAQFPRVDLTIDVDGKTLDYSFFFSAQTYGMGNIPQVWATLSAAVYRQGTIVVDGKRRKIAVLDYNSNGRFDDCVSLPTDVTGADNELVACYGDALVIESPGGDAGYAGGRWVGRLWVPPGEPISYLAGVTIFEGKYYHVKVSPTGDELTWAPSPLARGQVASPQAPCEVDLIGELGQISLNLEKGKPATLPAGQWRVLSYTIHVPKAKQPPKKSAEQKKATAEKNDPGKAQKVEKKKDGSAGKPSAGWSLLAGVLGLDSPGEATEGGVVAPADEPYAEAVISAQGTTSGEKATVRAGATTVLKFGPPYKPRVSAVANSGVAYLSLAIVGADGEKVNNLLVNGRRPDRPTITITDPQDKVVAKGNFEYG